MPPKNGPQEPSPVKLPTAKAVARPAVVLPDVEAENTIIRSAVLAAQLEQVVEHAFGQYVMMVPVWVTVASQGITCPCMSCKTADTPMLKQHTCHTLY